MRTCWVYIMSNRSGTLYIGVTGDLARRIHEHRNRLVPGFTSRYQIDRLVHAEPFSEVRDAIAREKQIKGWLRAKKLALITESNPDWRDLGEEWFGPVPSGGVMLSAANLQHLGSQGDPCAENEILRPAGSE